MTDEDHEFDLTDVYAVVLRGSPRGSNYMWRCECGQSGRGPQSEARHKEKHKTDSLSMEHYVPVSMLEEQEEATESARSYIREQREKLPPLGWLVMSEQTLKDILHDFLEAAFVPDFSEHRTGGGAEDHSETLNHAHRLVDNAFFWVAFSTRVAQTVEAERG